MLQVLPQQNRNKNNPHLIVLFQGSDEIMRENAQKNVRHISKVLEYVLYTLVLRSSLFSISS